MNYFTKIVLALTLCLLILLCVIDLTGCGKEEKQSTLTIKEQTSVWSNVSVYKVVDKETGVCYLYVRDAFHSELTPMYNSDGSVKVEGKA